MAEQLCEDCPPPDYPTDRTRCASCPRRTTMDKDRIKEIEGLIEYFKGRNEDNIEPQHLRILASKTASALRQLLEERQWKPIDDEVLKLWDGDQYANPVIIFSVAKHRYAVARYWSGWSEWRETDYNNEKLRWNPTHWMSLPAPPLPIPPEEG